MTLEEVKEARRNIELAEEHLECVGGPHKQAYITGLEYADKVLEKMQKVLEA